MKFGIGKWFFMFWKDPEFWPPQWGWNFWWGDEAGIEGIHIYGLDLLLGQLEIRFHHFTEAQG
jgi:hypothetical protein